MQCLHCLQPLLANSQKNGMHITCFSSCFKVSDSASFLEFSRISSAGSSDTELNSSKSSFFHGKFKKYTAILEDRTFILKMHQREAPEIPAVEYLCNQIGAALHVPVAPYFIISLNNALVFVTENFTQHQITPVDLQHIYRFRAGNQHTCKDLIATIEKHTKRPEDVQDFIRTILFDALIGNHDRHGRNLGFLVSAAHTTLAPIYDNVSYLGLESGEMLKADFHPTGRISTTHTQAPSMQDYVKELLALGFKSEVTKFFTLLFEKEGRQKIQTVIEKSFCSLLMKQAMKKLIDKRYQELIHAYQP